MHKENKIIFFSGIQKIFFVVIFILSFFMGIHTAAAATILKVSGAKVIVNLEGEDISIGDEYFSINSSGKKIGIIVITEVRNGKARAEIKKGKAEVGNRIQGGTSKNKTSESNSQRRSDRKRKNSAGLILGYHMQNMTASYKGGTENKTYSLNLNGSSLSYYGFYNYIFSKSIIFELGLGLYQLNVGTTLSESVCIGGTANCFVDISYLNGSVLGKYYFEMSHPMWVGGGVDFLMPTGKKTTVLDVDNVGFNQLFRIAAGIDLHIFGKNAYLPLQIDYSLFPPSPDVNTSALSVRMGYGMYF